MATPLGKIHANREDLDETEYRDAVLGMNTMHALNIAGAETDHEWKVPLSKCCIRGALALRDTLHRLGRLDAAVFVSGVDLLCIRDGMGFAHAAIGSPDAERVASLWNAHVTVALGNILLDPTHGQLIRPWHDGPDYVALVKRPPQNSHVWLQDQRNTRVRALVQARYEIGRSSYQLSYFKLTYKVERRIRGWRSAPDARPERRQDIVDRAIELYAQIAAADTDKIAA